MLRAADSSASRMTLLRPRPQQRCWPEIANTARWQYFAVRRLGPPRRQPPAGRRQRRPARPGGDGTAVRPDDRRAAREQRLSRLGGGHKISLGAGGPHGGSVLRFRSGWRNRASPTFLRDTGSDKMFIPGAPFPDRAAEKAAQSIQFVYLWNKTQILSVSEGCCRKKENRRTFDRIDGMSAGPGSTEQPGSRGRWFSPSLSLCGGAVCADRCPARRHLGTVWWRGGRLSGLLKKAAARTGAVLVDGCFWGTITGHAGK